MSLVIKGLRVVYYACKLLLSFLFYLIYLRWSIRRAKIGFKKELIRHGIPMNVARELASFYDGQNKMLLRLILSRF